MYMVTDYYCFGFCQRNHVSCFWVVVVAIGDNICIILLMAHYRDFTCYALHSYLLWVYFSTSVEIMWTFPNLGSSKVNSWTLVRLHNICPLLDCVHHHLSFYWSGFHWKFVQNFGNFSDENGQCGEVEKLILCIFSEIKSLLLRNAGHFSRLKQLYLDHQRLEILSRCVIVKKCFCFTFASNCWQLLCLRGSHQCHLWLSLPVFTWNTRFPLFIEAFPGLSFLMSTFTVSLKGGKFQWISNQSSLNGVSGLNNRGEVGQGRVFFFSFS